MLLLHFELDDINKCSSVADVYHMMGIGIKEEDPQDLKLSNKDVFGKKAYYKNFILSEKTSNRIYEHLKESSKGTLKNPGFEWSVFGPVSDGERVKQVEERVGELNDSVLYILTPEDDLYEEEPFEGVKDEQSTSNS